MKTVVIKNINKEITAINPFTFCYFDFLNLTSLIITLYPSFDENIKEKNLFTQDITSKELVVGFYVDGRKLSIGISLTKEGLKIRSVIESSASGRLKMKVNCKKIQKGEEKANGKIEMTSDFDGKMLTKTGNCTLEKLFMRGITENIIQIKL